MTTQKKAIAADAPRGAPQDAEDAEIEKIMSEIEELEGKMEKIEAAKSAAPNLKVVPKGEPEPVVAGENDVMREFQGSNDEPSMEETLADLKDEEPRGPSLLDTPTPEGAVGESEEEVEAVEASSEYADGESDSMTHELTEENEGTLSMTLTGHMKLKLKYEYEGQEVTVGFSDGALRVCLSDGTEFKIPVARKTLDRAA